MFNLKPSFFRNLQYAFLLNIVNRVINALTIFIISVFLPAAHYGKYVWIITVVSYFAILCDLGIETYAQREVAENSRIRVSDIFYTRLFLSATSFLACFVYLLIANPALLSESLFYIIPFYLLFFSLQFTWYFSGRQAFKPVLVGALIQNIGSLIVVLLGVFLKSPSFISVSLLASYILSGIYFFLKIRSIDEAVTGRFVMPPLSLIRKIIAGSFSLGLSRALSSVAVSFDVYLIGIFLTYDKVGQYFIVFRIIALSAIPVITITSVLQPALSNARSDAASSENILRKTFLMILAAAFLVSAGLLLFGNDLFVWFYKGKYGSGHVLFALLGLRLFFVYLSYYFLTVLVSYRKDRSILAVTIFTSVFSILMNFIFIPKWGVIGAAVVSLITETITCAGYLVFARPFTEAVLFQTRRMNYLIGVSMLLLFLLVAILLTYGVIGLPWIISMFLLALLYCSFMISKIKYA